MRDRTRRRITAQAKSHRATPEELRDASKRLKEIRDEMLQVQIAPETRKGEEREQRYARYLRIRSLRQTFHSAHPLQLPAQPNGVLLAFVMAIASFFLCATCAVGGFAALQLVQTKPDPNATASGFWYDMEQHNYVELESNYLSPILRVQYSGSQFLSAANYADTTFGYVTSATEVSESVNQNKATLVYTVKRSHNITYTVKLQLSLYGSSWGVDNFGAAIDPTLAGIPAPPTATSSATPSGTPSATPGG